MLAQECSEEEGNASLLAYQSPVSPQISDSRKFPTMSDLSSKHTLSSCSLAFVGKFRQSEICGKTELRIAQSNYKLQDISGLAKAKGHFLLIHNL